MSFETTAHRQRVNIGLIKRPNYIWEVRTDKFHFTEFETIELACDFLITLNISDDEIDLGLISIYANEHSEASFTNGKFVAST